MKIGIVAWHLCKAKGGIERVASSLANFFCTKGDEVILFYNDPKDSSATPAYPLSQGVEIANLCLTGGASVLRARKMLVKNDLDVLIAMFSWDAALWMPFLLNNTGIPFLFSEHNDPVVIENERWNAYERRACMAGADLVHVLSEKFKEKLPAFLQEKTFVIPNSCPIPPSKDWHFRDAEPRKRILAVGRMVESHKQFSLLISAFARIARELPEWDLVLVGGGGDLNAYKELVRVLRVDSRVIFTGEISDVDKWYAASHIFCIPSRYEGFGLVTTEAQGHGLPVVGFAECSGTNDIIIDSVNGVLVPEMNDMALAVHLKMLAINPALRKKLGENGYEMLQRYSKDVIFSKWYDLVCKASSFKNKTRLNVRPQTDKAAAMSALSEILNRKDPFSRPF